MHWHRASGHCTAGRHGAVGVVAGGGSIGAVATSGVGTPWVVLLTAHASTPVPGAARGGGAGAARGEKAAPLALQELPTLALTGGDGVAPASSMSCGGRSSVGPAPPSMALTFTSRLLSLLCVRVLGVGATVGGPALWAGWWRWLRRSLLGKIGPPPLGAWWAAGGATAFQDAHGGSPSPIRVEVTCTIVHTM